MKKYIKNILLTCAIVLSVMACTENKLDVFKGTDLLYFQWSVEGFANDPNNKIDSTGVSFSFEAEEVVDSIYNIPIKVLGNVSDSDRPFKVEVLPTSTAVEGVDFIMPESVFIPAQSVLAMLPVKLLRTAIMKEQELVILIRLVSNEYFNTDYFGTDEIAETNEPLKYNEFELTVSDVLTLTEPFMWRYFTAYLGPFSAKKFILFASVNNIPVPEWSSPATTDSGNLVTHATNLHNYLVEQKANGTPVLEDDGSEMVLGSVFGY